MYPTVNLTKGVTEMTGWRKYLVIAMLIALIQCKEEQKPAGIMNEEEMVSLLVELYAGTAKERSVIAPQV